MSLANIRLELPEQVWREFKAEAALRGVNVKDLVAAALVAFLAAKGTR